MRTAVAADEPEDEPPGWQGYLDFCRRNWEAWEKRGDPQWFDAIADTTTTTTIPLLRLERG
jgi:hypothetical protein